MKDTAYIIKYLAEDSELRTLLLDIAKCYETNDAKLIKSMAEFEALQESDYEKVLYIDFYDKNLTEIPINIEKCKNLLALNLSEAKFDNFKFLTDIKNLKILFLDYCRIEIIPTEIFSLNELELLSLSSNTISYISQNIHFKNLVYLDLSFNELTDFPNINNINSLQYLNIESNQIAEKPFFLQDLQKFLTNSQYEYFHFFDNPFIDENLQEVIDSISYHSAIPLSYYTLLKLFQFPIPQEQSIKPNENYFTLTLHKSFQTALIQYLYSFKEYVEIAKDKQFDFHIKQQQTELILITNGKNEVKPEELERYFKEYVAFALQKSEERTINDETKHRLSKIEGDVLFLKIDQSVDNLRNALEVVKLDLYHIKKDNETLAIANENLKNETKIYKDEVSFLRTLSLKQADAKEIAIKIANPQQTVTDLDQLLLDLMDKLVSMAERKYTIKIEDLHNDNLTDFLHDKGYNKGYTADPTRSGRAKITSGEIDIMIRKANGTPISIIEAFRLSSAGSKNTVISSHISKLLNDYDTIGHERNFIIVYAEAKDFETLCENYETYMSEINGKDGFQATYPQISFKNTYISKKTDLKVYLARHSRSGGIVEVYHLVVNLAV
jgi:Leucine-rich repeat (LRR) protein